MNFSQILQLKNVAIRLENHPQAQGRALRLQLIFQQCTIRSQNLAAPVAAFCDFMVDSLTH